MASMVKVSFAKENIWRMMGLSILCFLSLILQHDYITVSGRAPQHNLWRSTPQKIEISEVMNQSEHLIEKSAQQPWHHLQATCTELTSQKSSTTSPWL